jgi:hypothetical protein
MMVNSEDDIPMSSKGTGFLNVTVELLEACPIWALMPGTYRIVGSERSLPGIIRFVVESDELSGSGHELTCVVTDHGSIRKILVTSRK